MNIQNRRKFITTALTGVVAAGASASSLKTFIPGDNTTKAIAFDASVIFNAQPVSALAEKLFAGKGDLLIALWGTKQFEYTSMRTLGSRYKNFWAVTQDALRYSANELKLPLTEDTKNKLMDAWLTLSVWPDVLPALDKLKQKGIRFSLLSNATPSMLDACLRYSGINGYFERVLSTDSVSTFKPDPAAYQVCIDTLKLKKSEILFVAYSGWDAVGAKWFGYPVYWVNRQNTPAEGLDISIDGDSNTLDGLVEFVNNR